MLNKILLGLSPSFKLDENNFNFISSGNFKNINFFNDSAPASWKVYINGKKTNQNANAISFNSGDLVSIIHTEEKAKIFSNNRVDCFSSIIGAIPPVTSKYLDNALILCKSLKSIDKNLLKHNTQIESLAPGFNTLGLESIPEGLFDSCTNLKDISGLFRTMSNLKTVPINLFANNLQLTTLEQFFRNSTVPNLVLRFKATNIINVSDAFEFAESTPTVYVPSGSKTASKFKAYGNCIVIEE